MGLFGFGKKRKKQREDGLSNGKEKSSIYLCA